jgi:hypothetical protein
MRKGKVVLAAVAVLAVFALSPLYAAADTFTFDMTVPNTAISPYAGPYATVSVNLVSGTTATITFTSDTAAGNIYLMGSNASVAVNVNAASWTLGTVSGSNSGTGFLTASYSNDGAKSADGFGSFNQTIKSFDGFTHSSSTISFTLRNNRGTWAHANQVLVANAKGYLAAMHVFVTSSPARRSNGARATGYAANGPVKLPEPGVLTMLLVGLFPLGGFLSRLRCT